MAVDNENTRRSILPVLPRPNNDIDAHDKRSVLLIYNGFIDPDAEMFPGAVTATPIGVGAVTAALVGVGAITATPIGPGAVTAGPKTS